MSGPSYKRPESVLVVVHTAGGEVLLLRRREPAGWWQSVTGSLERGESPLKAALRELREETGAAGDADLEDTGVVNTYPIIEPWRARFAPGTTHNLEHVFRLVVPGPFDPSPAAGEVEHDAHAWLPKAAALERAASATDREAIRALVPG